MPLTRMSGILGKLQAEDLFPCCLRATGLSPAPEAQHATHGLYERAHDFAAQHLP